MAKEKQIKFGFDIPEDFEEQYEKQELYSTIRDNKKIYAMTTFLRAIPYNRDGLIEVYRRGLFDLIVNKHFHTSKTVKSALVVGDIIGNYHPHGDASAYKSLVSLSQPWTNNYPLVFGQGNWGNILGDSAAHYRYTECRLSEFFDDACEEINERYVDYIWNFDGSKKEVRYLPFKVPILLVNGSYGIADAYMTSILPHNLLDVIDLCKKYIANKDIKNSVLCDGFYPDLPNYGIITNKSEIEYAYKFNVQSNIKMTSNIEIDRNENKIIIKDLPYNTVKSDILKILKTQNDKKHAVLSKVYNIIEIKTNRDNKMHLEFEVIFDKNSNILEIARDIEKYCLMKTIPLNTLMFDGEFVKNVSIKDIIEEWYETISTTKLRKISYHSSQYNSRKHVLEGMLIIYDYLDELIQFAKNSNSKAEIIQFLSKRFGLTDIQSEAISEMKIYNISKVGKATIIENIKDLEEKIAELDRKLLTIDEDIIADLDFLGKKYGRPRRTTVIDKGMETEEATQIPMSNGILLWTHNQFAVFDTQNIINGKTLMNGIKTVKYEGKNTKEIIGSHNIESDILGLLVFMRDGTAKRLDIKDIISPNNWISLGDEPVITGMIPILTEEDKYITISNSNKIKVTDVSQINRQFINAGDVKLVQRLDPKKDHLLVMIENGKYHLISIADIPELGRTAAGVNIELPHNKMISMTQVERHGDDTPIFAVQDNEGYSYLMKSEQEVLEETNRVNKPKRLFNLSSEFKLTNVHKVNIKAKTYKCVLIGKLSTSQISIQNIRISDMFKIPKRVPVLTLGVVSHNL